MAGMKRPRSGVSPMVSDLILTFVVVVAMSILLTWTLFYTQYSPWKAAIRERIVVEDVWFNATGTGMGLYIYNYGEVEVVIVKLFIYPGPTSPIWEGELTIYPGQSGRIDVPDFSWTPGQAYKLYVETGRGNQFEVLAKAPG